MIATATFLHLLRQIPSTGADLYQHSTRSCGKDHILVLLCKSTMVLCGEEADLPGSTVARSQLAQKGLRVVRIEG